jgi:hypothetical protein
MEHGMTEPRVANPRYGELERLRIRVARVMGEAEGSLDQPAQDFNAGKAWSGGAAEAFGREVDGRKTRLRQLAGEVRAAVEGELSRTPRECTPDEARLYRAYQRGAI